MKRILSILLCMLVAISFMPAAAFALDTGTFYPCNGGGGFIADLNEGLTAWVEGETEWAGNTFAGWFSSEVGGEKVYPLVNGGTYYAHWTNEGGKTVFTQPLTVGKYSEDICLYCGDNLSIPLSDEVLEEYGISISGSGNSATLTLDNASIIPYADSTPAIKAEYFITDLKIVLKGQNQIGNPVEYVEETPEYTDYLVSKGIYCLNTNISFSSTNENDGINISAGDIAIHAKSINTIPGFKGSIIIDGYGGGGNPTVIAESINILGGTLEVHTKVSEYAIHSTDDAININNCTLKIDTEKNSDYSAAIYTPHGLNIDKADVYISYKGAYGIYTHAEPYGDVKISKSKFVMETPFDNVESKGFDSDKVTFTSCSEIDLSGYTNFWVYDKVFFTDCRDIKVESSGSNEDADYGWNFKNSSGVFNFTTHTGGFFDTSTSVNTTGCDVYVSANNDGTDKVQFDPNTMYLSDYPYVEFEAKPQVVSSGGGGSKYLINTSAEHGSIELASKSVSANATVNFSVKPDRDYSLESVAVYTGKYVEVELTKVGKNEYSFKMPSSDVTIEAEFVLNECPQDDTCPLSEFKDLKKNKWYHDAIHYCLENDIMQGTGWERFEPNKTLTRAQAVTSLWRIAGCPEGEAEITFTDVKKGKWYTDAITWAASAGIVNGYSDDKFGTNEKITREEMAQLLYNYAKSKDKGFKGSWVFLLSNPDANKVHSWADEAMHWCVMKGIIIGDADELLSPRANATRAQAAKMYMNFIAALNE